MSNSKKANKSAAAQSNAAEAKKLSKAEREARTAENKAKNLAKQPETAEQKQARRLAKFIAENSQALADAGISVEGKNKAQLQAELGIKQQQAANPQPVQEPAPVFEELEELRRRIEQQEALLAQEQIVLWDEDLVNHGAVVSPTKEVSLPQEEATVEEETIDEPEEAVTMNTSTYTNEEILAVLPGTASTVQEAIEMAIKAAYQPDMAKVQGVYDNTFNSSKGLLERAVARMKAEAMAKYGAEQEARLIEQAKLDAEADAVAQVMADNADLGLTEEMLVALLEEERNLEASRKAAEEAAKAEAARVKAHARKQRELLAEAKADGMLADAEELAEELETLTNVSNAGALKGAADKIKQLAAAGKLTEAAVSNFVGQYRKAYMTWKSLTRVAPAAPVKRESKQQAAD